MTRALVAVDALTGESVPLAVRKRGRPVADACVLCNREPAVTAIAGYRIGAGCQARIDTIVADAAESDRLGRSHPNTQRQLRRVG